MKKWSIVAIAAILGLASATLGGAYAAEKLKVGFIYLGPIGDLGWTYQHDVSRKAMEQALGDKIETAYIENVPESADAERSIEQLVRTGHKLIFATSFGYMEATLKIANKYPNVFFEHCAGYKRAKNMSTYDRRDYEGRYISGQIAAKISKTGIIGYIVPFPIPPVISNINAMMLGAQSVRPDIKVKPAPVVGDGGKLGVRAKPDHIGVFTERMNAALFRDLRGRRRVGMLGQDVGALIDERLGGVGFLTRVASGMVAMSPYTNMPDDVKKMAMDTEAGIKSGKLNVFKCPITNQDGKTVECKGGDHLDEGQIRSMNWYVKGIDDKLPAQ